ERAEHEVDVVLGDHLLGRLHRARRVRLIVDIDDLDLVLLAADRNAAGLVGLLGPEIVTLLLLGRFRRQRPRDRQWRPEANDVLGSGRRWRRTPSDRHRRQGKRKTSAARNPRGKHCKDSPWKPRRGMQKSWQIQHSNKSIEIRGLRSNNSNAGQGLPRSWAKSD